MKTNILVVDDLKGSRLTLGGILEDEGHNVVLAENGYQAIEAARQISFDLIFMDIKMPGINGVQTFREVKKINPRAAVIMMTAYSVEDLVREALEEGAYAVIYKPFDIEHVVNIIESALRKTLILVVDDYFADRETLKAILEERGYRVVTAETGAEALVRFKEKHFDIMEYTNEVYTYKIGSNKIYIQNHKAMHEVSSYSEKLGDNDYQVYVLRNKLGSFAVVQQKNLRQDTQDITGSLQIPLEHFEQFVKYLSKSIKNMDGI